VESWARLPAVPVRRPTRTLPWRMAARLEALTAESAPQAVVEDPGLSRAGVSRIGLAPVGQAPRLALLPVRPHETERLAQPRIDSLEAPGLFIPQLRLGPLRPRITYGAQDFGTSVASQRSGRRGAVIQISERRSAGQQDVETASRAQGGKAIR
ncbi:MAG: hypothetical protein ACRD9L_04505, partial [Bryobacteraceae bacterium]